MSIKTKAFVLKFLAFSFQSISLGEGVIFSYIWKAWLQSVLVSLPLRSAFLFLLPSLLLHSIHSLNTDGKTKQGVYLLAKEKWLMGVGWENKWKYCVTQMKYLKGGERLTWLTLLQEQSVQSPKPSCAKFWAVVWGLCSHPLLAKGVSQRLAPPHEKTWEG